MLFYFKTLNLVSVFVLRIAFLWQGTSHIPNPRSGSFEGQKDGEPCSVCQEGGRGHVRVG